MINARQFSRLFHSFWRQFAPGLRTLAKVMHEQSYNYADPVADQHAPSKRGLSSELGFRAFCLRIRNQVENLSIDDAINQAELATSSYVYRLRRAEGDPDFLLRDIAVVDNAVRLDARIQCQQFELFCAPFQRWQKIEVEPLIPGCGFIDDCTGDLLIGHDLYESKSRIGQFEQSDLRQLITYAILSFLANPERISRIGILNPFKATRSIITLDEAIHIASGLSVLEFCVATADLLSSAMNSR